MSVARLGLPLSLLFLFACSHSAATPKQAPPPPEVGVMTLEPQTITLTTELPGRTSAYLVAEVRPQVSGIIQQRNFTEGSVVEAGMALYQIDAAPYRAQLASAEAAVARAEANLASAEAKADRYKDLVTIDAVSQQENVEAQAGLKQAQAELQAAKANVESAQINLGYTEVRSPIRGRIGKSIVTPGALVTGNQNQALATIQQLDPIYVDVQQSATELLALRKAMEGPNQKAKVQLILEDGSLYPHTGSLEFSDITVDRETGMVTLRAVFPNPDQWLLPGMFVRAKIENGTRDKAILAPHRAVSRNTKGEPTAWVVGENQTAEPRTLTVERSLQDSWIVTAGLSAGDQLILEGFQRIRPGTSVTPVPLQNAAESK